MAVNRRSFVKACGALPFVGKAVAGAQAAKLAGICSPNAAEMALGVSGDQTSNATSNVGPSRQFDQRAVLRKLMESPEARAEFESLLYQQNSRVHYLDVDLATKRSFSLAAKVTFQRQRNVRRALEHDWLYENPWRGAHEFLRDFAKRFFFAT